MPSVLIINTGAVLIELADGSIRLFYEGIKYANSQFVPFHIFGSDTSPTMHASAALFVSTYMIEKYGDDQLRWPAMARKFINSKGECRKN